MGPPLRVCYFGTYRASYGRNEIMIAGLRAQGVIVNECHVTLWQGIGDRVRQVTGGWRTPSFWWRVLKSYVRLLFLHARQPPYDVMVIGYPGPFDTYLGRLLSWWRRQPMILDHYMSLYLIALERGLVKPESLKGRALRRLEGLGLRLPDRLISDTVQYVAFHCETYGLEPDRFELVAAGADDRVFSPRPELEPSEELFRIVYYGTFIPNHGVMMMVKAASLLREHQCIIFDFYGEGPDYGPARQYATGHGLDNVTFHGWVEKDTLPDIMGRAHLCLGVFGTTPQSMITVQNKIWEAAAMARPLVSGDSPAIRAAFRHGRDIYLVERDDPQALADAILHLKKDPALRQRLSANAYRRFLDGHTTAALGQSFRNVIDRLIAGA